MIDSVHDTRELTAFYFKQNLAPVTQYHYGDSDNNYGP